MRLVLEELDASNRAEYLAYCEAHGREHDESYVPGPSWKGAPEEPGFLLRERPETGEGAGAVAGVLGLMLKTSMLAAGRARVAILHSTLGPGKGGEEAYGLLLGAAQNLADAAVAGPAAEAEGIAVQDGARDAGRRKAPYLYLFLPTGIGFPTSFLKESGFVVDRVAYSMLRPGLGCEEPRFPEGYRLERLDGADLEGIAEFTAVRNRNFREVDGAVDARAEDWIETIRGADEGGSAALLLRSPEGSPCGTIFAERDEEDGSWFIAAVSVDAEHRGKGLGRSLLRASLRLGGSMGFSAASLSVNESNKKALELYLSEGFRVDKSMDSLRRPTAALEH